MTATESYELDDRFRADAGTVFLTGIQALARLPLEQLRADRREGLRTAAFVSGYQGSPLGGFGEEAARAARLEPTLPIIVQPAMNEEYGASAVMGSQLAVAQPDCRYDGIVGIWYGKAPGVDRAADALRHAVYSGTSMQGGAVALVGDDPAAKSSTIPSSSAGLLFDMHMPILYPGDPAEALELGRHAIAISRATGLWVAMKIVADVADATASMVLHPEAFQPVWPLVDGQRYRHGPDGRLLTPHTLELEREIVEVRYELARRYATDNALNYRTADAADAWIGIVASGITYREVMEAFARLGMAGEAAIAACGIRLLKMGMPMPFNAGLMADFAKGVREILVIEEKSPNLESLIKDALYDLAERPRVVGKVDETGASLCPAYGALDADAIVTILRRRLASTLGDKLVPDRPERRKIRLELEPLSVQRTPFFCSGCPHNRSTQVPEGALVGAGIGCHTMTLLMDPERVGNIAAITCMGNEGTQWIGMSPFLERDHFIQNLGDGTFFHSGQLAVSAAVAAKVNITYKLLFNGTVAMTGGQDAVGGRDVAAVCALLVDMGVAKVLVTTEDTDRYRGVSLPAGVAVWPRTRLIEAQERLAEVTGVSVLIHDQACAAEARRDRKGGRAPIPPHRVVINQRLCEGCGDCGRVSNCLSVQPVSTRFGPKTEIDQTTCNFDYSCLEGDCPSFMTVRVADGPKRRGRLGRAGGAAGRLLGRLGATRSSNRTATAASLAATASAPHPVTAAPTDLPEPQLAVPEQDFALRITGIGGTGVVTVAQVLGTAAMLAGYHVRGLDQIGLSQKAGPVVSDVRLSRSAPTATNRLGEGQADLLLALDQLVAGSDKGLLIADPARTTVVGSTSPTPTGEMITHLDVHLPSVEALIQRIATFTRPGHQHWADAQRVTEELFGSSTTANLFVLGMAVQAGCLPVDATHMEAAIGLNGVAVAANVAAFRWGRAQIARPEAVAAARLSGARGAQAPHDPAALAEAPEARDRFGEPRPVLSARLQSVIDGLAAPAALAEDLARFAEELTAWQDPETAEQWLAVLQRVAIGERAVDPTSTALLAAVGANLYKLIAYKDEYEVARLMTDAGGRAGLEELGAPASAVAWRLHPPLLRAMGLDHKISIGAWATPGVKVLARAKVLRGTLFDPFRWAQVRRVERALPCQYVSALDNVLAKLNAANLVAAVDLAGLPDLVRGYEHIKLANVARYRTALAEQMAAFA